MLRQALCQSRRNALLTAFGIGTGILIHVGYSLLGIGLIIQQSLVLFSILKVIGASTSPGSRYSACARKPAAFMSKRKTVVGKAVSRPIGWVF